METRLQLHSMGSNRGRHLRAFLVSRGSRKSAYGLFYVRRQELPLIPVLTAHLMTVCYRSPYELSASAAIVN
jgi:hypothetical protein